MARRKRIIATDKPLPPKVKEDPHMVIKYKGKEDVLHMSFPTEGHAEKYTSEKIKGFTKKMMTQDEYFKRFKDGEFKAGKK